MNDLALRPLSLGEILDRAFSLYRSNFVLFIGIAGIPAVLSLAFGVFRTFETPAVGSGSAITPAELIAFSSSQLLMTLAYIVVAVVAYLFSQGATILAVSELYLGRTTSIAESLQKVSGEFWYLLGVVLLNGIATGVATLFLIIPGIYVACRLFVCVPVALIEKTPPGSSLSRSFQLTKGFAGRAFMILVLYVALAFGLSLLLNVPFGILTVTSVGNPGMFRVSLILSQIASTIASVLVMPLMLISNSVFYYDLRVRKEAFDLQFMMNPDSQRGPGTSGIPTILS